MLAPAADTTGLGSARHASPRGQVRDIGGTVLVDGERAAQLRERTLCAVGAFTYCASRPDGDHGTAVVQRQTVGVHQFVGVGEIASETDGEFAPQRLLLRIPRVGMNVRNVQLP